MPLYLDEDIASKELTSRLTAAGHSVIPVLKGASDEEAWKHAQELLAAVVTLDAKDFIALAEASPRHSGLLIVYREGDPIRDMSMAQIAGAINRVLERHGTDLGGQIINLNQS